MTSPPQNLEAAAPPVAGGRGALLIVFLVVFIDLLGFGIVLPLLPRIAEHYVEGLGLSAGALGAVIGSLMASFSLMQFIFAPVWGRTSDRVGRRPILLLGLVGSVLFYALFGFACSLSPADYAPLALGLFFATRVGQGIAGATISTAQAVIADCTPPERRKHGMALIGAAFGIGFTFGPLIGFGAMTFYPNRFELIGYTAAGLSLLALLLGLQLLPETRRFGSEPPIRRGWVDPSALRFALANPAIAPVVLTFFLASLGFGGFESTLALLLKDSFGLGPQHSFLVFAYVGFVLMLAQGFFYRRLASRLSEVTFMGIGIFFMAVGVASLGWVSYVAMTDPAPASDVPITWLFHDPIPVANYALVPYLVLGLTTAVFGFAFLTPSAQALISRRTPADRQGEILGVNQSASAMARILGPLFGLILYQATDSHLLPYAFGAVVLVLMLPMLPLVRRG